MAKEKDVYNEMFFHKTLIFSKEEFQLIIDALLFISSTNMIGNFDLSDQEKAMNLALEIARRKEMSPEKVEYFDGPSEEGEEFAQKIKEIFPNCAKKK